MATYEIIVGPYYLDGYIQDDYILDGTIESVATLVAEATLPQVISAAADLTATFTQAQTAGLLIQPNELTEYSWDDLAQWDFWPGAEWEIRGVWYRGLASTLGVVTSILRSGTAVDIVSTMSTTATLMRYGQATLNTAITVDAAAVLTLNGQSEAITLTTDLYAKGLRIQEIESTVFNACSLTADGFVTFAGVAGLNSQLTTTATSAVTWSGEAALLAQFVPDFDSNVTFDSGLVTIDTEFTLGVAVTLAKIDPYRLYKITPELRVIQVLAEPRLMTVPVNTRSVKILAEPRTIIVPESTRYIKVNVPPFKELVNERQI